MGKLRKKSVQPPRDMTPVWEARGYRGASVDVKSDEAEDKTGEEAYQRAFAAAAQQNPPRVPNPHYYPNSPSAQDYIKKRDQNYFPATSQNRNDSWAPPIPDMRRLAKDARNPQSRTSSISPAYPGIQPTNGANHNYGRPPPPEAFQKAPDQTSPTRAAPPLLLEPQFGPMGPTKMLR